MPARLKALDDGPDILLDKPVLLIGRHPECDVQLESRKISRRHCCLAQLDDALAIRDLGSTNGIRINGAEAREGRLEAGDEVMIGDLRYQIEWDGVPLRPADDEVKARRSSPNKVRAPADEPVMPSLDFPVALAEPHRKRLTPAPKSAVKPKDDFDPRKTGRPPQHDPLDPLDPLVEVDE
jgi:predicted component of type VI protein secretion system